MSENSNEQYLSHWLKKLRKFMDIMKVPTMHRNVGADGGSVKSWVLGPPVAPSLGVKNRYIKKTRSRKSAWLFSFEKDIKY